MKAEQTAPLSRPAGPVVAIALAVAALVAPGGGPAAHAAGKEAAARVGPATFISNAEMHKRIAQHRGQVVLLHLWATWCLPCLDELPIIGQFARDMKGKGVQVVSVSLDDPIEFASKKVGKLLKEKTGGTLTNVILKTDDPQAFIKGIDPRWDGDIPALFAYDKDGRLRKAHIGQATRPDLEKLVSALGVAAGP